MMEPAIFVSFGEIMLRLSPLGHERLRQVRKLDACFGGGEANVAVSMAQFGVASRFVTALPDNELGQACLRELKGWGVDTTRIVRSGHRLGIYFIEHGASQRASTVLYDRAGSAISELDADALDWAAILSGAKWFHFTGITPALSSSCATAVQAAAETAKQLGLTVSCDLNYRSKLWTHEQARATMTDLMPYVDVLLANEEDADAVFGIRAEDTNVDAGQIDRARYVGVARHLSERFGIDTVAITLRESHSASRNGWSGLLLKGGEPHFSRHYEIDIVDRVGSGDAFAAGLIYALLDGRDAQASIEFAAAAGCLKHSVPGDFNVASVAEVDALVKGSGSGRVQR